MTTTFSLTPQAARLPADIRPGIGTARALGGAGVAWSGPEGGVCVMMENETGGCFKTFQTPVLLFMTGITTDAGYGQQTVTGVVVNSVKHVELVTAAGDRIPAAVSENGLRADVPPGAEIVGEYVMFRNGKTLFFADSLRPR